MTLTNIGSQRLRISSIVASTNFSQTNNCGSSVAASASCTINATFQPNGTGTLAGAITITDNAANRTQSVSLTGVGTAVTLLPTGLAFGSYTVGTISSPHTVILTNYGSAALNIQSIHISGSDPLNFAQTNNCGTTVPARGTCTVSLTFTPKDLGKKTETLCSRRWRRQSTEGFAYRHRQIVGREAPVKPTTLGTPSACRVSMLLGPSQQFSVIALLRHGDRLKIYVRLSFAVPGLHHHGLVPAVRVSEVRSESDETVYFVTPSTEICMEVIAAEPVA